MKNFYFILFFLAISFTIKAQPMDGYIRFDGDDDELSIWSWNVFENNSDFTIEFWFRNCQESLSNNQAFLGNGNNIEVNMFPSTGGDIYYQVCANSTNNIWVCHQDHQFLPDLDWHHIAITYSNSLDEFEYFFDGVDGTIGTNHNYDFSANGLFYVGRSGYQSWLYEHFNGYMDELRISDTVRYNSDFVPETNQFVTDNRTKGLWHFNNTIINNSILDYSGNNNHLSANGAPLIILENDFMISQSNNTLAVPNIFDNYQWFNCSSSNSMINGETNNQFSPILSGDYTVQVIENTCPITLDCYNIEIEDINTEINEPEINSGGKVYPNPVHSKLFVLKDSDHKIEVYNSLGKLIYSDFKSSKSLIIDFLLYEKGIYYIKFIGEKNVITKKIIKN